MAAPQRKHAALALHGFGIAVTNNTKTMLNVTMHVLKPIWKPIHRPRHRASQYDVVPNLCDMWFHASASSVTSVSSLKAVGQFQV